MSSKQNLCFQASLQQYPEAYKDLPTEGNIQQKISLRDHMEILLLLFSYCVVGFFSFYSSMRGDSAPNYVQKKQIYPKIHFTEELVLDISYFLLLYKTLLIFKQKRLFIIKGFLFKCTLCLILFGKWNALCICHFTFLSQVELL